MLSGKFKERLGLIYNDESYIIQQKAYVLFWLFICTILVYMIVNVINLTTSASTHPYLISISNLVNMFLNIAGLIVLLKGRYNGAVFVIAFSILSRVVSGIIIKFDLFVQSGFNNNIYFTFVIATLVALLATRALIHIIFVFLILFNISIALIAVYAFNSPVASMTAGSTINLVIALIAAYITAILLSVITERALEGTEEELIKNKKLSDSLEMKVQELQAMYEEMESMNEALEENSNEIMEVNNELNIFKDFAEASTQGFVMTDLKGFILYTNASMRKIVGLDTDVDVRGDSVLEYFPGEYRDKFLEEIVPLIKEHKSWSGELPLIANSGNYVLTLQNIFLLRDDMRKAFSFANVVTDLTERKTLESQLIQAQKMEAVGRLAGGVAHDFNNYLTAIAGYGSLLISQMDDDDSRVEYVEEILKASDKSSALTRQLLTISKRQMLYPVVMNINMEVMDLQRMLSRIIGENIELITELEENLWSIRIDPVQVEQIILNLVINARDAMPDGGRLIVKTENKHFTEYDCVALEKARPGDFACLSVQDTGVGIKREHMDHIFEPFFSTKENGKGTGLGLSVIYAITQQQEGWINVNSGEGSGTIFRLFFPAVRELSGVNREKRKPIEELSGCGEHILVVEDKDEVRKFTVSALTKFGYITSEASTVKDALRIFREKRDNIDIILSDIKLPDRTGIDLIQQLQYEKENFRFLLTSGYMEKESLWNIIVENDYPFLPKPYTLYELLQSLKAVIAKNTSG
ncbi:MAG: hypothetical protein CVV44_17325 [Spirochaetae bacterium HGW-Spirochaetae-1]|nr:MAG: hypothetical protein CVV44_17325 [Spirochaetae bacterium HGW-Spirochaetae-1]